MGFVKLLRLFATFLPIAAVAAGVLFSFRYHPLIKRTIGPDGVCGPFDRVFVFSPYRVHLGHDGDWYSFLAKDKEGYSVVAAGREYGPFDDVVLFDTSSEGDSWGFVAQKEKTLYVVVDGFIRSVLYDRGNIRTHKRPGKYSYGQRFIWPREKATLSADGNNWIFTVKRPDGKYAMLNGREIGPYEQLYSVSISPSGDDWGIIAAVDGAEHVIVNGDIYGPLVEAEELELIEPHANADFAFSPDGTKWAARWALPGVLPGVLPGPIRLLINGEWFGPYEGVNNSSWSENWETWAVSGVGPEGPYFVVNGVEYGPYENTEGLDEILFPIWVNVAENGSSWGGDFIANGKWYVVVNDVVYGPHDYTHAPHFSPDGENWGITVAEGDTAHVVINGQVRRVYDASGMRFKEPAPHFWDGHCMYRFWADGAWYVDFDGKVLGPLSDDLAAGPYFVDSASDSWAYQLQEDDTRYLIINGVRYGPFRFVHTWSFLFNESGTAWAYSVAGCSGDTFVYIKDEKYRPFLYSKTYSNGNEVGFWAIDELPDNMYRLVKKTAP